MIVYQDMLRYLSSKDISLLVARDIRDDILAMALESQTRGLKVEEAFGDYQKFCDAVCANAVQETRLEKLLRWWRLLSSLLVCLLYTSSTAFRHKKTICSHIPFPYI